MVAVLAVTLLLSLLLIQVGLGAAKCFNPQTEDYYEQFRGETCSQLCSVMPFFSPDNSLEAYMQMIEEAKNSITIATPSLFSWNYRCSRSHDCSISNHCTGCNVNDYRLETFPLFPALFNALHLRNITVRILTNNYSVPTCPGKITVLDTLHINGALIRFYKTTRFLHAKFAMIDNGRKVLISSVNFSNYSFFKNRESGVIISDCENCAAIDLYKLTFEFDWEEGEDYVLDNQYTSDQIETITNPIPIPDILVYPPSERVSLNTVQQLKVFPNVQILGNVGPDYAYSTLMNQLESVRESILIHIYSISDRCICNMLERMHSRGINVTVLVSKNVFAKYEKEYDQKCYNSLIENGVTVQNTSEIFKYSHQKYWIIDNETVYLSTGNWDRTDFPNNTYWSPNDKVNRNMLVAMSSKELVQFYVEVFEYDFHLGRSFN